MIFKPQRRTDLALSALRRMDDTEGGKLTGAEPARAVETTASFLPQVMSPLVRAGWVVSERGPRGGYALTEASYRISFVDVVEATERPAGDGRCVMRDTACSKDRTCAVHGMAATAREVLEKGLRQIPAVPSS